VGGRGDVMVVENKGRTGSRHFWGTLAAALIGLATGALGGYFGYSFEVVGRSPLVRLKGSPNDSPLDEIYRGMARLGGLETSAGRCDGAPVPAGTIDREGQVIDQIEMSAKRANLDPPLNVARAIVAYRAATVARMHSDEQASGSAAQQETALLQAAGWEDPSSDHIGSVVRALDNCQPQGAIRKEKQ
jgi:hypothetical protein